MADMVLFYHAALGSPTVSTLKRAISRGYLRKLPQLTLEAVSANPPVTVATAKGHLDLTGKVFVPQGQLLRPP